MVNEPAYAPPLAETARKNIAGVVEALIDATGLTETFISVVSAGDSAFIRRLPETSINIRTYDAVMGRLSAIWPKAAIWPAPIPRPEPVEVPASTMIEIEGRIAKAAAARANEEARIARQRAREAKAAEAAMAATAGGAQAPANP